MGNKQTRNNIIVQTCYPTKELDENQMKVQLNNTGLEVDSSLIFKNPPTCFFPCSGTPDQIKNITKLPFVLNIKNNVPVFAS